MKTLLWIIAVTLLSTNFVAFAEHCEDFSSMWWTKQSSYSNDHDNYKYEKKTHERKRHSSDTTTNTVIVGNDKDAYGCIPSAGYTRSTSLQKCVRTWEVTNTNSDVIYYTTTSTSNKKIKTVYLTTNDINYVDHTVVRTENKKEVDKIITYTYYKDGSYSYEQAPANTTVVYVPKTTSNYKW